jgi:5-methylcytosine-specific restriction endonuclease McrA
MVDEYKYILGEYAIMIRPRKYTKEFLENEVKKVSSVRQLIQNLKLKETGGSYCHFKKLIKNYEIDTSHFTGMCWNKGKTKHDNLSLLNASKKVSMLDEVLFSENAPPSANGRKLKNRLIELGVEYKCVCCGNNGEWLGKPLILELDHINGINNDNRKENLQILCPNCHKQTPTWGNKKR